MGDVRAHVPGTVVRVPVTAGGAVQASSTVAVIESMKMEYVVEAGVDGTVGRVAVAPGDAVQAGDVLLTVAVATGDGDGTDASAAGPENEIEAAGDGPGSGDQPAGRPDRAGAGTGAASDDETGAAEGVGADVVVAGPGSNGEEGVRADLAEVVERHRIGLDPARPQAVERRRRTGQRSARENVDDLCDPGSFVEYGPLVIAAQRRRRDLQDLIERTPADGLVAGVGTVDGRPTAILSYDYTVLAGTQGLQNHRKKDRLFEIIERQRLPVVFLAEGGGGRPGDTDAVGVSGLDCLAFALWGSLSGLVPLVGIASGRCFAGNAAILGCCDVVIATEGTNIGMGGPAMVEGGGLGVFAPEDIGPMDVQVPNGVVDVAVTDEAEAVQVAKQYLSYFARPAQTPAAQTAPASDDGWTCADQESLRGLIPENRRQVYDVRTVVEALADTGSVLELRRAFGPGMVTALVRIEGRPVGIVANNPVHLAGAIDADGADKAARFLQLCDAYDVPLLFLCDTPGIMVGPEAEQTALVRHVSRLFVVGASLTVPFGTIILRKGYGLGAQTMAGGSFKAPLFCVAWPTGEFGGMGLEGAVRLGFRNELAAIEDDDERERVFEEMVARSYEHGKAVNVASYFEIDDVIDPADSRRWIATTFAAAPPSPARSGKKRPCIDTW